MRALRTAVAVCALVGALAPASSHAAWPGREGRIALVVEPDVQSGVQDWESRIVTVRPNGTHPIVVHVCGCVHADVVWSPDGRRLATQMSGRIAVMNADGRGFRFITSPGAQFRSPSWSPDGRRIAASRWNPATETSDVFSLRADGGGERRLTRGQMAQATAWSSSGRLAYVSSGRIITIDGRGRHRRVLSRRAAPNTPIDWNPAGTRLLFERTVNNDSTAWTVDRRGRERRASSRLRRAFWSPAGRRLARQSRRSDGFDLLRPNGSLIRTVRPELPSSWGFPVAQAWQPRR